MRKRHSLSALVALRERCWLLAKRYHELTFQINDGYSPIYGSKQIVPLEFNDPLSEQIGLLDELFKDLRPTPPPCLKKYPDLSVQLIGADLIELEDSYQFNLEIFLECVADRITSRNVGDKELSEDEKAGLKGTFHRVQLSGQNYDLQDFPDIHLLATFLESKRQRKSPGLNGPQMQRILGFRDPIKKLNRINGKTNELIGKIICFPKATGRKPRANSFWLNPRVDIFAQ